MVSLVSNAYQLTPVDSPLRKFMCHCIYFLFVNYDDDNVRNVWKTKDLASAMSLHQDLTIDFLNLMRSHSRDIDPPDPRSLPDCVFHCHGKDEPCSQRPN